MTKGHCVHCPLIGCKPYSSSSLGAGRHNSSAPGGVEGPHCICAPPALHGCTHPGAVFSALQTKCPPFLHKSVFQLGLYLIHAMPRHALFTLSQATPEQKLHFLPANSVIPGRKKVMERSPLWDADMDASFAQKEQHRRMPARRLQGLEEKD